MGCQILLVFDTTIKRHKHLKICLFRQLQQFPIFLSAKTSLGNGGAVVACELILEFSRHALIEQNSHRSWLMTRALACSSASTAV